MDWSTLLRGWQLGIVGVGLVLSVWAAAHAVMYRRDPRAAALWVGIVFLVPLFGSLLYFLFGVNRMQRWAGAVRSGMERFEHPELATVAVDPAAALPEGWGGLARAIGTVVARPLVGGNRVEPLVNGDAAYPAMLEAIHSARTSVTLATYIFDADEVGQEFARALGEAVRRGVAVRVLVDATGARYSWPQIFRWLRKEGVPYARFLRMFSLRLLAAMNLRNHRKLLVVDGRLGFTGGMNLRVGHWLGRQPRRPVQDLHFRVEGPVVAQLQEAFVDDWQFTTGEALRGPVWFPSLAEVGTLLARGIVDGPDEDFERLRWALLAAVSAARTSIRIATPYFLPDPGLLAALNVAALRGVRVDILLPGHSNLPLVHWASRAHWWQVLQHGCRLWLSPPPFDHSKVLVVDDGWSLIGSANWDSRSLRLNFEFNLECYDASLAGALTAWFEERRSASREVTLAEVDARKWPVRLLDGTARLFAPFM